MLRTGGDGASGMVANFSVSLPAFTHGAQATIWIDLGLSFHERILVLAQEQERYREQLERYVLAVEKPEARRGLYFPLLKGWREWY